MNESKELIDVVALLWKKRKQILLVTFLAALISVVVSLLLPNYYAASTSFYAASQDLAKPSPIGGQEQPTVFYGTDSDLDRLFSMAQSEKINQFLIDSFDLYKHYEIDPDDQKAAYKIRLKLQKLYSTVKTKYDALELIIEDKDPIMATKMANATRNKISQLAMELLKNSQSQQIQSFKDNIQKKEADLSIINDSLIILKNKYGVVDLNTQSEVLMTQRAAVKSKYGLALAKAKSLKNIPSYQDSLSYINAMVSGYKSQLDAVEQSLSRFNQGINIISQIDKNRAQYAQQISIDRQRLNQYEAVFSSDFATIHVIQEATVPVVKSRPKRSIYVIGATIFGFALSVIAVLLFHSYNEVNWTEALKDK